MLDSGILGRIAHPRANVQSVRWLEGRLQDGARIIIPEIADYEVRRSFLLHGLIEAIRSLDRLKLVCEYCPITTDVMLQAAKFWALSRRLHRPTCDPKELDGDAILGAQARKVDAVVVTDNVGHLSLFVQAQTWEEISSNSI